MEERKTRLLLVEELPVFLRLMFESRMHFMHTFPPARHGATQDTLHVEITGTRGILERNVFFALSFGSDRCMASGDSASTAISGKWTLRTRQPTCCSGLPPGATVALWKRGRERKLLGAAFITPRTVFSLSETPTEYPIFNISPEARKEKPEWRRAFSTKTPLPEKKLAPQKEDCELAFPVGKMKVLAMYCPDYPRTQQELEGKKQPAPEAALLGLCFPEAPALFLLDEQRTLMFEADLTQDRTRTVIVVPLRLLAPKTHLGFVWLFVDGKYIVNEYTLRISVYTTDRVFLGQCCISLDRTCFRPLEPQLFSVSLHPATPFLTDCSLECFSHPMKWAHTKNSELSDNNIAVAYVIARFSFTRETPEKQLLADTHALLRDPGFPTASNLWKLAQHRPFVVSLLRLYSTGQVLPDFLAHVFLRSYTKNTSRSHKATLDVFKIFAELFCAEYTEKTLLPAIVSACALHNKTTPQTAFRSKSLHSSLPAVKHPEKKKDVFLAVSLAALKKIVGSPHSLPEHLRAALVLVDRRIGDRKESLPAIAGLVFSTLFCPALADPVQTGLVKTRLSASASKALEEVARFFAGLSSLTTEEAPSSASGFLKNKAVPALVSFFQIALDGSAAAHASPEENQLDTQTVFGVLKATKPFSRFVAPE
ncbi:MAG: uncharacterized protein A8A55_1745 [Amphiamblys sp. WSBS2006]|nr:MAG: uncharacterized protein A8A55_1745 [Amphiamblys sp. WSBS2006]